MNKTEADTIFNGRVVLKQPEAGYRFSVDSLLLVAFAGGGKKSRKTVDLGAGCGVVGLGLLAAGYSKQVIAIEAQERLAGLARDNARENGFSARYSVVRGDIRQTIPGDSLGQADMVVSNPPFWPVWERRMPRDEERRIARHEVLGGLEDWIRAARQLLHPKSGRFYVVYPVRRLDELLYQLCQSGLSGTRMQLVFPSPAKPAEQVLVEARPGKQGRLEVQPSLVLKDDVGNDSPDLQAIVSGEFSAALRLLPDRRRAPE